MLPSSNLIASTPPMGWNSWNTIGHAVNESVIRETADALISTGLKDYGYNHIVIDDCWSIKDKRDDNGDLIADPERNQSAGRLRSRKRIQTRHLFRCCR
jgi:alpha-galactosidase